MEYGGLVFVVDVFRRHYCSRRVSHTFAAVGRHYLGIYLSLVAVYVR